MHYYTTSASDKDAKIATGFTLENVYYIYPTQAEWTVPLYHSEHVANSDHFYTTSKYEYQHSVNSWGFTDRGVVGYIIARVGNNRPQGSFGGVGMATGNMTLPSITDISLSGVGPQLSFTRYYDSFAPGTTLGQGWSFNYDSYIQEDASGVHLQWGDGRESHFDSALVPYPGYFEKAVKIDDGINYGYDVTTKDQSIYKFRRFTSGMPGPNILLIYITDRNGNTLSLSRQASYGFVMRATDATGRVFDYTYNPVSLDDGRTVQRLTKVTDTSLSPNRVINLAYNAKGNLTSVSDARNSLWTTNYVYNADGLLTGITYPEGNTVSYTYGSDLRVLNSSGGGISLSYTYNAGNSVVNSPQGAITYNPKSDNSYRLNQIQYPDASNSTIVPTYDNGTTTLYLPMSVKDRNGNVAEFTYDANGNVLTSKSVDLNQTTTYTYDTKNNPLTITDPRGNVTTFTYDANGNLLTLKKPLNGTTTYTYYSGGRVDTVKDPNNHTLKYYYDDNNGNLTKIHDNALGTDIIKRWTPLVGQFWD